MILPVIGALIGGQITVTRTGKLRRTFARTSIC
jgi:hypothetical protein